MFDSSLNPTFSKTRQHPQPTHSPKHNGLDLDFPRNQSFPPLEQPYGLHTHPCGLQSSLGRQLPKLDTAGRKPAGTRYPHIGDSSRKFPFLDSFRTPIAPKPELSRNTHPCCCQGSSSPYNFQVFDSSLSPTFSRTRQHPQPTHSPKHNGLDLDFPRNQSFPARTAIWSTHPIVWSSILTRSPTP